MTNVIFKNVSDYDRAIWINEQNFNIAKGQTISRGTPNEIINTFLYDNSVDVFKVSDSSLITALLPC
jgi:hypothetical protein